MSDKTCGNCLHWHHMKNDCGACLESYSGALSQEVTITGRSESCLIVLNSWAPKTTDTLEQRYQQLAEVAREMCLDLDRAATLTAQGCRANALTLISLSHDDYRRQLEELGVEL